MSKPFRTINEQYNILINRGVTIVDENKAKTYLLENNYYNIINCYGKFFTNGIDSYIQDTNFDKITQVHYFDKEIKSLLFKYILEAEKHLKSIIAYYFSEAHSDQYSYLIATNFKTMTY